jgi:ribose transport system substrate-binding protein
MKARVVVCSLLALALLATSAFATGNTEQAAKKKDKFVLGYQIYFEGNAWSLQMAEEFKQAVRENQKYIDKVYYTSDEYDITKQIANFEDLLTKGCDAIFVTPLAPDVLVEKIKAAEAQGVKVIVFGTGISGSDYTAYVNVDDFEHGKVMAQWLADVLKGKGKIAMISGIAGTGTAIDCKKGAMSVFEKYPNIKVMQEVFTGWDYSKTKIATQDLLQAYPDLDGIWTHSEPRACAEVFIDSGKPFIPITWMGENGSLGVWKKYKDKGLVAEAFSKPPYISRVALEVGLKALRGEPFKKMNIVPVHVIKANEIDKFYKPNLSDKWWTPSYLPEMFPK